MARDAAQEFAYSAEIVGRADGALRFSARGRALTDFLTNRTGFVVLHPIQNVAGRSRAGHRNDRQDFRYPISRTDRSCAADDEPACDPHEFAPGATVECRMEGDTFEMEDQRNWTDASYKTYVRPLALPWPYTLANGETSSISR